MFLFKMDFSLKLSMICFCSETRFTHTIRETLMPSTYFLFEQISGNLQHVLQRPKVFNSLIKEFGMLLIFLSFSVN